MECLEAVKLRRFQKQLTTDGNDIEENKMNNRKIPRVRNQLAAATICFLLWRNSCFLIFMPS
jgi:hypothetical protein